MTRKESKRKTKERRVTVTVHNFFVNFFWWVVTKTEKKAETICVTVCVCVYHIYVTVFFFVRNLCAEKKTFFFSSSKNSVRLG